MSEENEEVIEDQEVVAAEDHEDQEVVAKDVQEEEEVEEDKKADGADEDEDGPLEVVVDEEESEETPTFRELRQAYKRAKKESKELKDRLKQYEQPQPAQQLPKKPALEDFDYDSDQYESAMGKWYEQKAAIETQQAQQKAAHEQEQAAYQVKLNAYYDRREKIGAKDYENAEQMATEILNEIQQGIIVNYAQDPAIMVYALGKNPARAKKLSAIQDPISFALAVDRLERDLKLTKKAPPPPEPRVGDTAPKSGVVDSTLDKLRRDAERTGDYSKVVQYKRQKK